MSSPLTPEECAAQGHPPVRRETYNPPLADWWRSRAKIRWFCECGEEIYAYEGEL